METRQRKCLVRLGKKLSWLGVSALLPLGGCSDGSSPAGVTGGSGGMLAAGATGVAEVGGATPGGSAAGGASASGTANAGSDTGGTANGGATSGGSSGGVVAVAGTAGSPSGGSAGAGGTDVKFSFFVTSLQGLLAKAGASKPDGFGGDFRFGETGAGAGLRGADKICAALAEDSLPGAGKKPWRAFLSAVSDDGGKQVDAIARVGEGPWYDRLGRVLALTKADLLADRPKGADAAIINDLPNEAGVPNHQPDPNLEPVDNHHMLTGTDAQGKLMSASATCLDWTANAGDAGEGQPRGGLAWPRGAGGGAQSHWMSAINVPGCAPSVKIVEMGGPTPNDRSVGNGGGYGGFYCFSTVP